LRSDPDADGQRLLPGSAGEGHRGSQCSAILHRPRSPSILAGCAGEYAYTLPVHLWRNRLAASDGTSARGFPSGGHYHDPVHRCDGLCGVECRYRCVLQHSHRECPVGQGHRHHEADAQAE
ncbi:unnamed protein product, partial [Symbiodinium sp. CCMP2456]